MAKRGPASGFKPEYCKLARKFCILGATNEQLAEFFEVALSTIGAWLVQFPEFKQAVYQGRAVADADVAESLYGRATGYDRKVEKIVATAEGPEVMSYTRHYEADTAACIFWLRNRQARSVARAHRARASRLARHAGHARGGGRTRPQGPSRLSPPAMTTALDIESRLHREIGAFRFDPLGYVMYAFPGASTARRWPPRRAPSPGRKTSWSRWATACMTPARRCAAPSPRATASASRRWSPGSSCGRCRPCPTPAAWSAPTPRASCAPRPGPSSPSGIGLCLNRDWFEYTATSLHSVLAGRDRTWRVDAITWSENNTEAIAGLHNKGRRAFVAARRGLGHP